MKNLIENILIVTVVLIIITAVIAGIGYLLMRPVTRVSYYEYNGKFLKCERIYGWGLGDSAPRKDICVDK